MRVLVNGRAAPSFGSVAIPLEELVADEVAAFFRMRLPELGDHWVIELNVTSNPSPGAVLTGSGVPDRIRWFAPESTSDLRELHQLFANDSSLGTGWAPRSRIERFTQTLADHFSKPDGFGMARQWCGTDVKVMAWGVADEIDVALAVPTWRRTGHYSPSITISPATRQRVSAWLPGRAACLCKRCFHGVWAPA